MKFYRVNADCDGAPYFGTLSEAQAEARNVAKTSFDNIEVLQVEIALDKTNVLRLLNVSGGAETTVGVVFIAAAKRKKGN